MLRLVPTERALGYEEEKLWCVHAVTFRNNRERMNETASGREPTPRKKVTHKAGSGVTLLLHVNKQKASERLAEAVTRLIHKFESSEHWQLRQVLQNAISNAKRKNAGKFRVRIAGDSQTLHTISLDWNTGYLKIRSWQPQRFNVGYELSTGFDRMIEDLKKKGAPLVNPPTFKQKSWLPTGSPI